MENALKVIDLWKKFRIPHEKRQTIIQSIATSLQLLGKNRYTYEEFWALKGVDFSIRSRESMGIIGENGSGKSTLLKIIAKILRPDKGSVQTNGTTASILELGVGFHGELTVKENVRVYGAIMGLRSRNVKDRMDSILDFAGIARFRDAKLKNLSSGMQMRLAFSVAIETNPDIFLVDEALAVGDLDFQKKCMDKFREFKNMGKTIVLVTHGLNLVKEFCEHAVLLSKGEMIRYGPTGDVIAEYENRVQSASIR